MMEIAKQNLYNFSSSLNPSIQNMIEDVYPFMNHFGLQQQLQLFSPILPTEHYLSLLADLYCLMGEPSTSHRRLIQSSRKTPSESARSPEYEIVAEDHRTDIPFKAGDWIVCDKLTGKVRPPRQNEFLFLILENPRYAPYVQWLDKKDGVFKILKPEQVASLWYRVKNRRTQGVMDYDTFARGIRYYYKIGLMMKTHRKYTFRFNHKE